MGTIPEYVRSPFLSYTCALRTHKLDDAAVTERLAKLGAPSDWAPELIDAMDKMNWSADSNSRPTAIGWLSILVAVVVTGGGGFFLAGALSIPLGGTRVVFTLPFVVLGFLAHIGVTKLMEGSGIRMSVAEPVPIPDEEQLKQLLRVRSRLYS